MEALAGFTATAVEALAKEGYCVVQLPLSEDMTSEAAVEVKCGRFRWKRLRREFEPAYVGKHQKCKTAWLDEMVEEKPEMDTPIDPLDLYLARFTQFLLPVAPFALDFMPHSRTSGMLRIPATSDQLTVAETVSEEDIAKGLVDEHVDFLRRRKLCMFLIVDGSGGELSLYPKDGDQVTLSAEAGRLVIFRHDRISYAYRPDSEEDLVLQGWVLTAPAQFQVAMTEGDQKSKDEAFGLVAGPNTPEGRRICVFGVGVSLPAAAQDYLAHYWCGIAAGTDGYVKAPIERFDIDQYTRTGDDWQIGWTYTIHGGYCKDIFSFDNDFFNVPEQEAWLLAPANKQLLERSYEALFNSGVSRKDVHGRRMGVYIGHSGDDWSVDPRFTSGGEDMHKFGYQARKWSCIAGRIAYILGLKGPQALLDTACSSALVAYGVGHTALRRSMLDQPMAGANSDISEALMGGANLIPGPGNYINLCGPHMLSVAGRCFTFDMSADGFERGEGSSCFFARSEESVPREALATVIGACLNQDGRTALAGSASMTAPNGPSQQECVRGSMREAGLTANQITCSELHGTGTALGDPIEVGALKGVMQDRKAPIMQTSAKSHIGHLEANAGQAGIIKCMLMCNSCAGTPNCHLYILNPHLDINGYPTVFNTELAEYGNQSGYSGVSSFGFGGANARADVFAIASRGPRKPGQVNLEKVDYVVVQCPIDEGPMHYIDGREVPTSGSRIFRNRGRYRCDNIRDEFDNYDYNSSLYEGKYQMSPPEEVALDRPDAGMCRLELA
ncbi:Phenolphthiocerol/phthiocerol polyketide synthase subunit C ((Phenol)carboxyphthiodiolenone synthase subunit C) (Beta-ketoacyl-acyl-carrier-protein synthase I) (Phthiocerol synthesis polyketide synthase type I PpsC) [Durusdinium trenchii]|uniref:Ketosynthase family 3 (KS3) domain-containing protein n=1 Tax=Durusdinium trenchii TaxID=1381693 RepID=A0ABP0R7J8_9DINO